MGGHTIGHYRILEKLGEGGMGVVYRAHDEALNRVVALKVLPRDLAASPERVGRFRREAEALAALDHPSIVTIHSIEEAEGVPFITMQLVEGRSLAELIPAGGLPVERLLEIAAGVAEGLLAAHRRGVIHRDLKPGNVMVDAEGRVKMLDFGLAKLRADGSDISTLPTAVSRDGDTSSRRSWRSHGAASRPPRGWRGGRPSSTPSTPWPTAPWASRAGTGGGWRRRSPHTGRCWS